MVDQLARDLADGGGRVGRHRVQVSVRAQVRLIDLVVLELAAGKAREREHAAQARPRHLGAAVDDDDVAAGQVGIRDP